MEGSSLLKVELRWDVQKLGEVSQDRDGTSVVMVSGKDRSPMRGGNGFGSSSPFRDGRAPLVGGSRWAKEDPEVLRSANDGEMSQIADVSSKPCGDGELERGRGRRGSGYDDTFGGLEGEVGKASCVVGDRLDHEEIREIVQGHSDVVRAGTDVAAVSVLNGGFKLSEKWIYR